MLYDGRIPKTNTQFMAFCADLVESTVIATCQELGVVKPTISRREANRLYGEKNVDAWIEQELIQPNKKRSNTSTCHLDRAKCAALFKAQNRWIYIERCEGTEEE